MKSRIILSATALLFCMGVAFAQAPQKKAEKAECPKACCCVEAGKTCTCEEGKACECGKCTQDSKCCKKESTCDGKTKKSADKKSKK